MDLTLHINIGTIVWTFTAITILIVVRRLVRDK